MGHWTLRRKLVTFVVVIMFIFLVARGITEAEQARTLYLELVAQKTQSTAEALAVAIEQGGYWDDPLRMQDLLLALKAQRSQSVYGAGDAGANAQDIFIVDRDGGVLTSTDPAMMGAPLPAEAGPALTDVFDQGESATFTLPSAQGETHWLAVPVNMNGQRQGALVLGYPEEPARTLARARLGYEFATILVVTMGLVLILLVGIRKMVLRPLSVLRDRSERLGQGELDSRIDLKTGDELEIVANAFNRMAAELKSYQAERVARERQVMLMELAGTTADELSQPLTVVMGYAELLREQEIPTPEFVGEAAQSIQRGSQKMAEIVRQLSSMSDGASDDTGPNGIYKE